MEKAREIAIEICSVIEDLLHEYDLTIPTEEREEYIEDMDQWEKEGVARLFGEVYYSIEDKITNIIQKNMKENQKDAAFFIGYNSDEDYRILISAKNLLEAKVLAKEYLKDTHLQGKFTVTEATINISNLRFDCDYIIEENEDEIRYIDDRENIDMDI